MLLLAAMIVGCGGASAGPSPVPPPASVRPSGASHVVEIVMENKEYGEVIGNREAPYLTKLAGRSALATSFYAIRHPSLPNYLALTGGSTFGVTTDCTGCQQHAPNLITQLEAAGVSWKAYMGGMPRPCFKGAGAGAYAKKHNPFLYFDDVANSPRRCAKVVPDGQLRDDLRKGSLPAFAWISPGLCNDTHDCSIATGDRYLARLVPALLRALGPRGVLILTWDEGTSDRGCCGGLAKGGRVVTVVAGPDVRAGARLRASYSHFSTLRTVESAFGLKPLGLAGRPQTVPMDAALRRPLRLPPVRSAPASP